MNELNKKYLIRTNNDTLSLLAIFEDEKECLKRVDKFLTRYKLDKYVTWINCVKYNVRCYFLPPLMKKDGVVAYHTFSFSFMPTLGDICIYHAREFGGDRIELSKLENPRLSRQMLLIYYLDSYIKKHA